MFKKLEELLEAGAISKEAAEAIDGEITTAMKSVRDEAAKYRAKAKEVEDQYKAKLEEQRSELENQLEEAKKAGESEVAAKYEERLKAVTEEKETLVQKTQKAIRDAAISNAVASVNVVDADLAKLYVREHIELDGDSVFIKVGEERFSFDNGVKKLFEAKPNLLASSGNSGSGAGGQTGSLAPKKKSEMSAADKAAFIKEHGQEKYLALQD